MTSGIAGVRALLDPSRLEREPDDAAGYLDLLGDADDRPRTLAQRAMHNNFVAAIYQRWWRPSFAAVLGLGPQDEEKRDAVRALGLGGDRDGDGEQGHGRVLDVACGPGNFTRAFAEALTGDGLVVGLDASRPMLARAVADNAVPRAGYLRADARRLPFADASFDAVCCYAALYLVPEPFTVLAEMLRVLAPGGRIALMASRRPSTEPIRTAGTLLADLNGLRLFDGDELTAVLRTAGLVDIRQRLTGLAQFVNARRPG
ncbi:class I SAM-dependent methyltransferase [Pseudonocardia acaciae]|uniref:class I SAM-dependent methyltransferase n=1 Tax=Pseudonocardia acaciae TaxID=551276 RepID=UPI00048E2EE8|nr:class I SAM-dependent methyltransferase [Pseudonocardia acaciae]